MVKLFDEDIKTADRKSSKGNQLKFERDGFWYKADNLGYEGLAECVVSALLHKSSLDEKEFRLCPVFDNGGALLSDTRMDYPLGRDVYEQMGHVRPKTFGETFEEQLEISEKLYGNNISFTYSEKDVDQAIGGLSDYSTEEKERVKEIVLQTRRKYGYLFSKKS